jgi:hypothetical protein
MSSAEPLVNLSEEEQWKIINETGVLHKFKEPEANEPHFLVAALLSIPLFVCHGIFDYLVHLQFGFESEFTVDHIIKTQIPALPAIFVFSYVTNYFKKNVFGQIIISIIACIVGCYALYFISDQGTFGAALKTPGLITMGILLIIQADLQYAMLPIFVCLGYYYREWFKRYIPTGSFPKLRTEL